MGAGWALLVLSVLMSVLLLATVAWVGQTDARQLEQIIARLSAQIRKLLGRR